MPEGHQKENFTLAGVAFTFPGSFHKESEGFCSSFLCFTARIISAFKRTASVEIIDPKVAKTQGEVLSLKFQTKCGSCGQ